MTEPQGGSDPTLFTTRAVKDGDEWVINGWKYFSSNAKTASFLIVMAVTNPDVSAYRGMSMFLVPADTPEDPYGTSTPTPPTPTIDNSPPPDTASGESKATFFANLGSSQLANGDTSGAAANFKKALELDAKNAPATIGMGEIALRQGLFGDAIAHLKKAARLAPRTAKVFVLLGEAYLNSGNNAEAAANFKKALQLDPDNARARDGYNEASARVPPPEQ